MEPGSKPASSLKQVRGCKCCYGFQSLPAVCRIHTDIIGDKLCALTSSEPTPCFF